LNHSSKNKPTIKWRQALNPAIYLVSVLPGIAVWLLSASPINHSALWAATFAVVLLQHGINLLNDTKDWQLGADTEKYDSWVRVHHGNVSTAFIHGLVSLITGGILGLLILFLHQQLWILGFALPLVVLGILYNAGHRPLSYTAAGEWATALCYGPGVFGGLWFVAEQPFGSMCLLAVTCWGSRDILTATVFTLTAITSVLWLKYTGPNPKRILQYASSVFIASLSAMYLPNLLF
jgi:1,4-dihydroxy-2-naphthoate octaprenyltransferase